MNPMDNILSPPTNIHENTLNPVKIYIYIEMH